MTPKIKKIRDPVHKDVYLDSEELRILDTPPMQRLRGIRQLGTAFFVYPGALHSRFEHSLGTCWMSKKLVAALEEYGGFHIPKTEKKAAFLAALTHDVTHIPFGHTFEDERKLLTRHDEDVERYERMLLSGTLGERLKGSEAGRLALEVLSPRGRLPCGPAYIKQIVDGMICADLLDYLKRDNYFCGLSQLYDDRVFNYFGIHEDNLTLTLHQDGIFRHDALSEITHLLRIRYVLSERVYYHHAKIASGVMISKAIERALHAGMRPEELYELRDDALPWFLKKSYGEDKPLCELLDWFSRRQIFKRCYMLSRRIGDENVARLETDFHHNRANRRDETESRIAAEAGAAPHEIAVYCPSGKMALKEARMPAICAPQSLKRFCDLNSDEIKVLQQQHKALWKFFVFVSPRLADQREKISRICREILGFENELPEG